VTRKRGIFRKTEKRNREEKSPGQGREGKVLPGKEERLSHNSFFLQVLSSKKRKKKENKKFRKAGRSGKGLEKKGSKGRI